MDKKYVIVKWFILIVGMLSLFFVNMTPSINLYGDEVVDIEVFSSYKEEGYVATYLFKDVSDDVLIKNNLDTSKVGKYKITYTLDYDNYSIKESRIINVVDTKKPVIKLKGNDTSYVCPGHEYIEEGYEVTDNYDSSLEDSVLIEKGNDEILYKVIDNSGNENTTIRHIVYQDSENPVINLVGDSEVNVYIGSGYYERGYTAFDNCDGDITSKVSVNGSVNTSLIGKYTLTYSVTDSSSNKVEVNRIVNVIERKPVVSGVGKTIYLTFDDGPSNTITPSVLQILREEDVKATFFVVNRDDSLNYLIKQAYDDGHTIALHSYTHDYGYIYSSVDNYFNDLNLIGNKVKNITGVNSHIIRFPGGSSNTVSRRYSVGIMTTLSNMVLANGYSYFDWNVDSCDAGNARTENDVYYNVTNNLVYQNNVVLMHDFENNYKTLNALRNIIRYGKQNGYTFKAITSETQPSRHRVNN